LESKHAARSAAGGLVEVDVEIEFIYVTHSMVDCVALAIRRRFGVIITYRRFQD